MAQRLEIKVDGEDMEAEEMLKIAMRVLKQLKAVEHKLFAGSAKAMWHVDMMSGADCGLIAIWACLPERQACGEGDEHPRDPLITS